MPGFTRLPGPDVDHVLASLRALRDELRLEVHLLRTEVADGLRTVSDALDDVVRRVEGAPSRGALESHLAWMEARDRFAVVEPALRRALQTVRRSAADAADALPFEAARLQATLAAMDARDAVEARRRAAPADLQRARATAESALVDLAHRLEPVARAAGGVV